MWSYPEDSPASQDRTVLCVADELLIQAAINIFNMGEVPDIQRSRLSIPASPWGVACLP